jgi:hypothetical protein
VKLPLTTLYENATIDTYLSSFVLEHQVDDRVFEPPPRRDVGELSACPLEVYTVSLAERRNSIALHYTENKVFPQSPIVITPLITRLDRANNIHISICIENSCLEMIRYPL